MATHGVMLLDSLLRNHRTPGRAARTVGRATLRAHRRSENEVS